MSFGCVSELKLRSRLEVVAAEVVPTRQGVVWADGFGKAFEVLIPLADSTLVRLVSGGTTANNADHGYNHLDQHMIRRKQARFKMEDWMSAQQSV